MLMNLFYSFVENRRKTRVHFNGFMLDVHRSKFWPGWPVFKCVDTWKVLEHGTFVICTTILKVWGFLCLPRVHLFDTLKISHIAKYYYNLKWLFYFDMLKWNLLIWWQSWIFSIITPVFSVTWSFRNHSNTLIWCLRNIS